MAEVPVERQFAGQARLIRLLLWKIGEATDLETCLDTALDQGMIAEDDRAFLTTCMAAEESMRSVSGNRAFSPDHPPTSAITQETVTRLRRCADKLNRADSA